jgi:hypothetical protein
MQRDLRCNLHPSLTPDVRASRSEELLSGEAPGARSAETREAAAAQRVATDAHRVSTDARFVAAEAQRVPAPAPPTL